MPWNLSPNVRFSFLLPCVPSFNITCSLPMENVARADPTKFSTPSEGSWCISLSLQESSPPTHLDPRLLISEASIPDLQTSSPKSPPALESSSSSLLVSPYSPFQPNIPGNLLSPKLSKPLKPNYFHLPQDIDSPTTSSCEIFTWPQNC